MKKNFFRLLLLTALMLAGGNAWAGEVTTIYERGTSSSAWDSDDLSSTATVGLWSGTLNGNTGISLTSDPFLQVSARGKTTTATGTLLLKRTAYSIVTLDAVWNVGASDFPSYDNLTSFTYGGFTFTYLTRTKTTKYSFNGTEQTITSIDNSSDVSIHMVVNSKDRTISEFSVTSGGSQLISLNDLGSLPAFSAGTDFDNVIISATNNVSSNNTRGYLKSITVAQETQDVQSADYTVNWVCNNQTVKTETRNSEVDSGIVLNNADKEAFFNSDETKRYLYVSDNAEGKTVSGETTTVVTITVKEAAKYAYTVTSAYNGQPLDWSTTGEVWEDLNTVTVQYPRFQAADNVLVQRAPVSNNLQTSVTVTSDGFTTSLDYTQYNGIDNLYLLSEAENLETGLSTNATSFTSRVSNGQIAFGASGTLLTLPAGSYIFTFGVIGGDGSNHQVAYTVSAGETQIIEGTCTGNMLNLMTSEEFTLNADTPITFTCSDPSSSRGIDLVFVQKTADAVTKAYTINYQFEGETVFTETGEGAQGAVIEAKESVTVTTGEGDETTTQTYYLDDNQTTSLTIDADEANNVLNVAVRLPRTADVIVNAVDNQGTVLRSFTAEATEGGEAVWVYYTRAVEVDGVYYTVPANNGNGRNYGVSKSYGDDPTEITYTKDESISYYAESEDLNKSRSYAAEGQAAERASGGHWWRLSKASYAYTPALEGGVYTVYVSGRGERAAEVGIQVRYPDGTLVGENTLTWASSQNAEQSVEGVNVPEGCSVAVVNPDADYNNQLGFDYIILSKTGEAETELITVTSAGARTYCSENVLDFSNVEGLKAYYLTVEGDQITMNETSIVGGYVAVYIEAAEGSYEVPVMNDLEVEPLPDGVNDLVGVTEETQVEAPIYVLMNADNGLGFYKTSQTFTVGAHTAYIPGSKVTAGVKSLTFMNDEPTGISGVNADSLTDKNAVIYNLAGQRVAAPAKGIYIVNGKKVLMK